MELPTRLVRHRRFGRSEVIGLVVVGATMIQFGYTGNGRKGWLTLSPCESHGDARLALVTMAEEWCREGYQRVDWWTSPSWTTFSTGVCSNPRRAARRRERLGPDRPPRSSDKL